MPCEVLGVANYMTAPEYKRAVQYQSIITSLEEIYYCHIPVHISLISTTSSTLHTEDGANHVPV